MPEGTFKPEGKLPTSHSHAFDKAFDKALIDALRSKGEPDVPSEPFSDPEVHDVTYQVTLKWSPNPGWEVDTYIAKLGS